MKIVALDFMATSILSTTSGTGKSNLIICDVSKRLSCPHLGAGVVSETTLICGSTAAVLAQSQAALLVLLALVACRTDFVGKK